MGNNACKKLGIQSGSTISTADLQAMWQRYQPDSHKYMSKKQAKKFLKELAEALEIKFDTKIADDILKKCSEANADEFSFNTFRMLIYDLLDRNSVSLTDSLQIQKEIDSKSHIMLPCYSSTQWTVIKTQLEKKITNLDEFGLMLQAIANLQNPMKSSFLITKFKRTPTEHTFFFQKLLPFLQGLSLEMSSLFPSDHSIPQLIQNVDNRVELTRKQIACLNAFAFLGGFSTNDTRVRPVPSFTWLQLHRGQSAVMEMCYNYFKRLYSKIPEGTVEYHRHVLKDEELPDWPNISDPITIVHCERKGSIENSPASTQIDFANEYIGGSTLSGGVVQEEIIFGIAPEAITSMLLCSKMKKNEAIKIRGAGRFSNYSGYGHSLRFAGDHSTESEPRRKSKIISAIDALVTFGAADQWAEKNIRRDLNKAFIGFSSHPDDKPFDDVEPDFKDAISTGNWGCGAFGGDMSLKFFQQLLAASLAKKELFYYTFSNKYPGKTIFLDIWIKAALPTLKTMTIGQIYTKIVEHCNKVSKSKFTPANQPNLFKLFISKEDLAFVEKGILPPSADEETDSKQEKQENNNNSNSNSNSNITSAECDD